MDKFEAIQEEIKQEFENHYRWLDRQVFVITAQIAPFVVALYFIVYFCVFGG